MGNSYFVINKESKKSLRLGKGLWFLLPDNLSDLENVRRSISEDIITKETNWASDCVNESFHNLIAISIINMGGESKLVDENEYFELEVLDGLEFNEKVGWG